MFAARAALLVSLLTSCAPPLLIFRPVGMAVGTACEEKKGPVPVRLINSTRKEGSLYEAPQPFGFKQPHLKMPPNDGELRMALEGEGEREGGRSHFSSSQNPPRLEPSVQNSGSKELKLPGGVVGLVLFPYCHGPFGMLRSEGGWGPQQHKEEA